MLCLNRRQTFCNMFWREHLKKIISLFQDLIFPRFCVSCKREGEWLCQGCFDKFKITPQFFCPVCYRDNENGQVCHGCQERSFLDGVASLSLYNDETTAQLIKMLKYEYVEEVGEIFAKLLKKSLEINKFKDFFNQKDFLIPIPLHRDRYLERGFNQAEVIGGKWSEIVGASFVKDFLIRQRKTDPQAKLNGTARRQNLQGAFAVKNLPLPGKIILIDDVFTTGSTMQECAKVLKEAGVGEIWGLTVAREQ